MEPLDPHLFPDGILDNTYQILQVLGRGGMATVYEALSLETGARVAIKVMLVKPTDAPADIQPHFFNELLLATRVRHPRIVDILDFGVSSTGEPYIVMERLYGHTIFHEIRQNGPMDPQRSVARMLEVLDGLEAAHTLGVVHADIKPTNLFLCHPGTPQETVTILDFGVARQLGRPRLGMGGTPRYAPPEWLRGAPVQVQGDLYQAGMVLAEMLSGETLLQATTVRQCLAIHASGPIKLPPVLVNSAFREVIEIAMDPDPTERFQSVAELRRALLTALDNHQRQMARLQAMAYQEEPTDDGGKTVRFDDFSDFSDAVLAEDFRPREPASQAGLLGMASLGAPVMGGQVLGAGTPRSSSFAGSQSGSGPRSASSINVPRSSPSLEGQRSSPSLHGPRSAPSLRTPVPGAPRSTPSQAPRSMSAPPSAPVMRSTPAPAPTRGTPPPAPSRNTPSQAPRSTPGPASMRSLPGVVAPSQSSYASHGTPSQRSYGGPDPRTTGRSLPPSSGPRSRASLGTPSFPPRQNSLYTDRPLQADPSSRHLGEPGLQDGAQPEMPPEGTAPSALWKTLLLDSLPPDERIAILGLLILLCFSLTGGAFLGSMLISVIMFAR